MNIFKKGAFTYDPNMTPQQLADKRAMLAMLQPKYGKASYIGEGLGQLATGVATGIRTRKLDEIEGKGREQGANLFSGLFGNATQSTSGQSGPMNILGVDPGYAAPPTEGAAVADDAMLALGKTPMRPYRDAIAGIESAGSGDYGAIGPTHPTMGRAMGRYQIMESNIGPWSLAALGREVTPDEFMANPQIQDAIFDHRFGGYLDQFGPEGAAQAWFAGPGGVGKTGRKDVLGTTVGDYGQMFMGALNGPVAAPAGASTATNSAMPSIDPQALASALANPWLSPEQRSVLMTIYDQQVQAGDPLRQIEVAKGMAELDKMNAPAPPPEELLTRMALLDAAGVDRNSPEGQTYLLTGKMPGGGEEFTLSEGQTRFGPNGEVIAQGPAKPGYRPMTPQEVTATPGLDPGKAWQVSPDGKIEQIGGGGVTVNNSIDGGGKFEEAFAKGDAETIGTVYDAGLAATRNLGRIDQLETLLQGAPSGMGGRLAQMAGEWGLAIDGTDAVQAAQAMINSLVPEQRPAGSGPMSDADLELFKQSLPRIINTPGGNQMIVDTMRAIAQYDAQGAEIVQRMRLPEGDPNRLTRAEAFQMLQERQNPLSAFKGQAGAVPATAAPAAGGGTTINGHTIKPVN